MSTFLTLYLQICFALIFSYAVFSLSRRALILFKLGIVNLQALRIAQILVLCSIIFVPCLELIPEKSLPSFEFSSFHQMSENIQLHHSKIFSSQKPAAVTVLPQAPTTISSYTLLKDLFLEVSLASWVWIIWSAGFGISVFRRGKKYFKLKELLGHSNLIRKRGCIKIVATDLVSVPFAVRLFGSAWVVLPNEILERTLDYRLAITHELQHHRQGDTRWAILIEALLCVFYLNPAIYLWKKEIIELQEFSCDEALIGQKRISSQDYGSCLVRVAETALKNRELYVGTTCMATVFKNPIYFKSFLRRRIEMIVQKKSVRPNKGAGACVGTVSLLFTAAVAFAAHQSTTSRINPGVAPVDEAIQKIADTALSDAIKNLNAEAGFAIVADPNTGKILAIANIDTKNKKKGHWALSEQSEPASLMKAITAAEAIEEGATTPSAEHYCENGTYQFAGHAFHDWKKIGFDKLTTTKTVAVSSDICSMKIAEKLSSEKLHAMFTRFGFGSDGSAKQFPEARVGQVPSLEDQEHSHLILAAAYGEGFKSTPLEVVQAFGAIANGGNLLQPMLATASDEKPQVIRRVLTEENAKKMRDILQQVVLVGTASRLSTDGLYTMAGKTHSSYTGGVLEGDSTGGQFKTDTAGFVGFAPVANPRVEIYVQIMRPADPTGAHGSTHAAPLFKRIAEDVLKQMKVAPDKPQV